MKKFLLLLILIPAILTSCKEKPKESPVISKSESYDTVVYITKTGDCYHTEFCSSLRKSKIEKELAEVIQKYRPCQNCFPPIIEE